MQTFFPSIACPFSSLMQLGGYGKLRAMIGANNFSYDEKGTLKFMFRGCQKANFLEVILNPDDTYTMVFGKITSLDKKEVGRFEGVYWKQLKLVFEAETGLYLSL